MKITNALNPVHVYRKREWIWPNVKRLATETRIRLGIPADGNALRLRLLQKKHRGRRAFIIGNGPSLRLEDLNLLSRQGEITFAANKIYLAFSSTVWRPTYYLIIDELTLTDPRFYEQSYRATRFLVTQAIADQIDTGRIRSEVLSYREIKEYDWIADGSPELPLFSDNPLQGIVWGSTVTYAAIQFAAYMGIREVYLLGVDANYNPIRGVSSGGVVLKADGTENNHFHLDYHPPGSLTYPGEVERQMKSYTRALQYSQERGSSFRVLNATRGGNLEIFPRVDFDALF